MGADAGIFSLIRPVQAPDPLEQYGKMMSIKSLMGGEQLNEMQRTKLARDMQQEENFRHLFEGASPDQVSAPDFLQRAMAADPQRAMALQKNLLEQQTARAGLEKTKAETHGLQVKQLRDMTARVQSDADLGTLREAAMKLYGPQAGQNIPQSVSAPGFADWQRKEVMDADKFISQSTPKFEKVDIGGKVQMIDVNPLTNPAVKNMQFNKTATPGESMTDKRQRDFYAAPDKGDPQIEQQLDYWATVVRKGGTLPPGLARGPGGSAFVREVTKRAAMGDVAPEEMMSNQAQFQGEKAGQRTLGSRTANIEMAATEAASLADLAKQASGKVDRTQFKFFNDAMQAGQKATSSPDLRAFTASNTSLINAYARAINPQGVGTVADKEHARDMLSTAFSKGDYEAAVDQLLLEIDAARKSPGQVKKAMREQFTGKEGAAHSAQPPKGKAGGIKFLGFEPG